MAALTFLLDDYQNIPIAPSHQAYLYVQKHPVAEALLTKLTAFLNAEEKERAARFHFDSDRKRFIVARGLLRCVVSRYLNCLPQEVLFHYGPQGKPFVENTELQFNLSHSGDYIVMAVNYDYPIGVDVEQISRAVEIADIAARFFTANESQQILVLTGKEQQRAFFNVWTRKEALLKTIGSGLSLSLNACEVSVENDAISTVLACNATGFHKEDWLVHSRVLAEEYLSAAVVHRDREVIWVLSDA